MSKYIKMYLRIFGLSLMSEMTHRENFWTWVAIHTVSLASLVMFFKVIFAATTNINGWTEFQSLLVLGVGTLIGGLGSLTFFSFMYQFGREIQNGDFDLKLTKPIDIHYLSAFSYVDVEDFIVVPNSILLIIYALWKLNPSHILLNITGFLVMLLSSLVILFSLLTLVQSLAFKLIRVDSISNFYWSIVNIAKYPAKAIRGISIAASVLLIPIAIISSIPAEVLFGRWEWTWIVGSIIAAVGLFFLSRRVFMSSLRHYSSASS